MSIQENTEKMIHDNINKILSSVPHNRHYLDKYIAFIEYCKAVNKNILVDVYTEKHHICPKANDLFPQYKFTRYKWNFIKLTARQHYISHRLLYKTYPTTTMAYVFYNFCNGYKTLKQNRELFIINSRMYENLKIQHSKNVSATKINRVVVKNITNGETFSMSKSDFNNRPLPTNIFGASFNLKFPPNLERNKKISLANQGRPKSADHRKRMSESRKNMVSVLIIETNEKVVISKEEFDNNRDIYCGSTKGKIPVKDIHGNYYSVSIDDPRYVSGELVHNTSGKSYGKGTATAIDTISRLSLGRISLLDPRWKTGEIISPLRGISKSNKGSRWMKHKQYPSKQVIHEDINIFLENGWEFGRAK